MWNYNLESVPDGTFVNTVTKRKGKEVSTTEFEVYKVLTASKCGKIIVTGKLECGRWNMYGTKETPIAWQHLPVHPNKENSNDKLS